MPTPAATPAWAPSLSGKRRPDFFKGARQIRIVDLFAGCGGLTLGVAQSATKAGFGVDIRLAVDFEQAAVDVYRANFKSANVVHASVEDYFDGELGAELTERERAVRDEVGQVDILVGGPPCQGHSDLNNKTRRNDPKNRLYLRMARAAEVLKPTVLLIENVPTVRLDTAGVVKTTYEHLSDLGYDVASATLSLHALGVAQKRRRHVILATTAEAVDVGAILTDLAEREADDAHDLEWAIGDLRDLEAPKGYDVAPTPSAANLKRMQYLDDKQELNLPNHLRPKCHQDGNHSYKSMYGRLSWGEPAQTITSGFGSIGQGRYMHPSELRALTAHEAARIQGFPDYFRFDAISKRGDLAVMVGNAVPPALMREVMTAVLPALRPALTEDEQPAGEATRAAALAEMPGWAQTPIAS
ncbi:DNA cytosine methyltransferase [Microbacterium sp. KSW4-17]|uniref:DNA (cytosine-5-)-methyltransferase n=1 Tax=Microbacterium galbum TaxID=3075994 RepID=A0ABU3T688_9MICO|nr:DNA cytosine methyltransferase [Microbacterium sp. KSW4-17]MDU0366880.1 DNA cytosine methyltransferase [Microbacterium sp. KSW4-17]